MTFANLSLRAGEQPLQHRSCRTGDFVMQRRRETGALRMLLRSRPCNKHGIEMKNFREFVKNHGAQKVARQRSLRVSHLGVGFATFSSAHLFPPEIFATTKEHLTVEEKKKRNK